MSRVNEVIKVEQVFKLQDLHADLVDISLGPSFRNDYLPNMHPSLTSFFFS